METLGKMSRFWKVDLAYAATLAGALALGAMATSAVPAYAQTAGASAVTLSSEARIERTEVGADGRERTVLKSPKEVVVVPGDRVVFTLQYHNAGAVAANGFRATNPMPGPVQFIAAAEDWAEVSVDGGKSWGRLAALQVQAKSPDGTTDIMRAAGPEDVTHVRWVFAEAIAPGGKGSVSYRGVVK